MHTNHRLGDEVNLPTANFSYSNVWYTPRELICPDIAVPLRSWVDILVRVAEWLIRRRYLDRSYCPVQIGPKTTILNTWPARPDGTQFRLYTKIGDIYVNKTNVQTYQSTRHSIILIELVGLNPFDFRIYFEDRRTPDPK